MRNVTFSSEGSSSAAGGGGGVGLRSIYIYLNIGIICNFLKITIKVESVGKIVMRSSTPCHFRTYKAFGVALPSVLYTTIIIIINK